MKWNDEWDALTGKRQQVRIPALQPALPEHIPLEFSCSGRSGDVVPLRRRVDFLFKCNLFYVTDTATPPASGTTIESIAIGKRLILPGPVATAAFISEPIINTIARISALGLGGMASDLERIAKQHHMTWPTMQPGIDVEFRIRFHADCAWRATLWGTTIRP